MTGARSHALCLLHPFVLNTNHSFGLYFEPWGVHPWFWQLLHILKREPIMVAYSIQFNKCVHPSVSFLFYNYFWDWEKNISYTRAFSLGSKEAEVWESVGWACQILIYSLIVHWNLCEKNWLFQTEGKTAATDQVCYLDEISIPDPDQIGIKQQFLELWQSYNLTSGLRDVKSTNYSQLYNIWPKD